MANNDISPEVWAKKDDLSARQTAANVTGYVFEGKEVPSKDFLKYAEDIRKWLFINQTPLPKKESKKEQVKKDKATENPTIPTPTLVQKPILDNLQKETGLSSVELYPLVLEWSLTCAGVQNPTYPTKESSIKLFLDWLGEKK
jgi:hypothetical protein